MTRIKFCGMTRAVDAELAGRLGAAYVGVIFAGGPRTLSVRGASDVLAGVAPGVRRVGVFGAATSTDVAEVAALLGLNAVQLHAEPNAKHLDEIRRQFGGEVWAVLRTTGALSVAEADLAFRAADAVVIDAKVDGMLGGTGVTVDWDALAEALEPYRSAAARLVLAGGLRPENVARAVSVVAPDVVDVSSGVETAPGIKDHARMRAFADAVASAAAGRSRV